MSGIFLRWGVPALVTVIGGTSLAISATSGGMTADLASRATAALSGDEFVWASVAFDARDAVISGTAPTQQMIDAAVARVAAVHGVRSVEADIVLAEFVSPFPFTAAISNGAVTLSGGVPDEAAHAELLETGAPQVDSLRLMSGAPQREAWQAAVAYGREHLQHFDEGQFSLADLAVSISGRAKSPEAFDALAILQGEPLPAGVSLVSRDVAPPLASPFEWRANFDGTTITVSGFTPTEAFAEELRNNGVGGRPVSTSLVLASGAPTGFEETARVALENLVLLEEGSADISGTTLTLSGAPADRVTAERIQLAMSPLGATLSLSPPRVDTYDFVASRNGAMVILTGHVPDATTRDRLDAMDDVDATTLELARGAPDRFESGVDFGLELLAHLSEGRFTISNTTLAISGRAATIADFTALETALALGAPQGLILAAAEVKPPLATPFVWSAEKATDGGVRIEGYVPSRATRDGLQAAVADLEADDTTIADGNPVNFEAEAVAALKILPLLQTGRIDYDGSRWSMSGAAASPQEAFAANQAFEAGGLRDAGWSLDIDLPAAAETAALPIIDPYVWRAEKNRDGTVALGGFVPTEGLKQILAARAGEGVVDSTSLGAGHPESFIPGTLAGIDALVALSEGTLGFDGHSWSLIGQVATAGDRLAVEAALQQAVDTGSWRVAIQALDAAPIVASYRWMAAKAADGRLSLSGFVTTEELKRFVAVRAGKVALDTTQIASGEPPGFIGDILAGLEALNHLSSGTVKFEEGAWTLAGVPQTAADAELAVAALETATSGGAGWQKQISEPVAQPEPEPVPTEPAPEASEPIAEPTEAAPDPAEAPAPSAAPDAAAPAVVAAPESEPVPVVRDFTFSATKPLGGTIVLDGAVPADAARRFFGVVAGDVPTDNLTIAEKLPADFIPNADAGIRAVASLESGEFGLDGETWVLTGRAETEAERAAVLETLAAVPATTGWQTEITLLPPIDVCREKVTAFAGRNAILFQSGSARLAEESVPAIDELAGYLTVCPEATVHVEGHTDADGADDLNLALSVARAEAVVAALIERGIAYQRLYAVGYGESLPVADNATNAGKRANRRIAFTLLGPGEQGI